MEDANFERIFLKKIWYWGPYHVSCNPQSQLLRFLSRDLRCGHWELWLHLRIVKKNKIKTTLSPYTFILLSLHYHMFRDNERNSSYMSIWARLYWMEQSFVHNCIQLHLISLINWSEMFSVTQCNQMEE
jgi:hypothetical protein